MQPCVPSSLHLEMGEFTDFTSTLSIYRREWQSQETFGCVCLGTVFVFAVQKTRHWIIVKIVFYIVKPIKKLSLKYSFYEAVFTCFLTEFCKHRLFLCFKNIFEKNYFFLFFSFKLIFF
jgi:hypothetical protein